MPYINLTRITVYLRSLEMPTEEDLPENWMKSLLDLRETEELLFGSYSSAQQEFIDVLSAILCVGTHIASIPSKVEHTFPQDDSLTFS